MSRSIFNPASQILSLRSGASKARVASRKYASYLTVNSVNPILSPPTFMPFSLVRTPSDEGVVETTAAAPMISQASNFPSPMPSMGPSSMGTGSMLGSGLHVSGSIKKLILSTVPGFFGLMGLGQFYEKRSKKGWLFLGAGAALSILSSWYTILPERIYAFVTGTAALPPYALTWMSRITGYSAGLSEACIILLAFMPALWALQVYDSISPISVAPQRTRQMASMATVPMAVHIAAKSQEAKSPEQAKESVRKLAEDLTKTSSLFSYFWER